MTQHAVKMRSLVRDGRAQLTSVLVACLFKRPLNPEICERSLVGVTQANGRKHPQLTPANTHSSSPETPHVNAQIHTGLLRRGEESWGVRLVKR